MRLRIGDLVYYDDNDGFKGKGLVTTLKLRSPPSGNVEILRRKVVLRSIINRKDITKIIPREELKEWWKYL